MFINQYFDKVDSFISQNSKFKSDYDYDKESANFRLTPEISYNTTKSAHSNLTVQSDEEL